MALGASRDTVAYRQAAATLGINSHLWLANDASVTPSIVAGTTNGLKVGTAATQKLGLWDTAPVVQPAAVASLTNSTGVAGNDTVENVPAATGDGGGISTVSAAANVATVASVNTALTAIENDIADLTDKLNVVLGRLRGPRFIAT